MMLYVAHPLGKGENRIRNMALAEDWLSWLLERFPQHNFLATWLPYAAVLPESAANMKRGLRDDLEVLSKCDGIVLCGDRVSPGMAVELAYARFLGLKVVDYTKYKAATPPAELVQAEQ